MKPNGKKGHVEFHQPVLKLTADLPGDAEMREHLAEMKATDGYEGSCIRIGQQADQDTKTVE
jgi:hypothetical protein